MELAPNFSRDGRTSFVVLNGWEIDTIIAEMQDAVANGACDKQDSDAYGRHCTVWEKYKTKTDLDDDCETCVEVAFTVTRYQTYYRGDYYTPDSVDEDVRVELDEITATYTDGASHPLKDEQVARIKAKIEREVA